ncbi:MAG: tRNA pseudouridine(38-40) synthase TruA [Alphaproteobacteria bacterium]
MPRYRLTIEYDGSGFCGWQRQATGLSVQQAIEDAILRFAGEEARLHAAGRTDAGVHASGQVAHVDLAREWPVDAVRDAINFHVRPAAVAIIEVARVADDFHARIHARERRYLYRIVDRRAPLVLDRGRAWHVRRRIDADLMHSAAQSLVGRHDFTTFRAAECQARSPVKTLDALDVTRAGDEIRIEARARSFLHHQVRNMVGTLKLVGDGRWPVRRVADALAACDRAAGGPTAPPDGLFLVSVEYRMNLE